MQAFYDVYSIDNKIDNLWGSVFADSGVAAKFKVRQRFTYIPAKLYAKVSKLCSTIPQEKAFRLLEMIRR